MIRWYHTATKGQHDMTTEKLMTRRFSALITGDLMGEMTAADLAEGIAETTHCGSWGVLVPGVLVWQNVTVTPGDDDEVTIVAELLATDHVTGGDYRGDEVTESHIAEYISGAEAYWYGHGDEFFPMSVTITRIM